MNVLPQRSQVLLPIVTEGLHIVIGRQFVRFGFADFRLVQRTCNAFAQKC